MSIGILAMRKPKKIKLLSPNEPRSQDSTDTISFSSFNEKTGLKKFNGSIKSRISSIKRSFSTNNHRVNSVTNKDNVTGTYKDSCLYVEKSTNELITTCEQAKLFGSTRLKRLLTLRRPNFNINVSKLKDKNSNFNTGDAYPLNYEVGVADSECGISNYSIRLVSRGSDNDGGSTIEANNNFTFLEGSSETNFACYMKYKNDDLNTTLSFMPILEKIQQEDDMSTDSNQLNEEVTAPLEENQYQYQYQYKSISTSTVESPYEDSSQKSELRSALVEKQINKLKPTLSSPYFSPLIEHNPLKNMENIVLQSSERSSSEYTTSINPSPVMKFVKEFKEPIKVLNFSLKESDESKTAHSDDGNVFLTPPEDNSVTEPSCNILLIKEYSDKLMSISPRSLGGLQDIPELISDSNTTNCDNDNDNFELNNAFLGTLLQTRVELNKYFQPSHKLEEGSKLEKAVEQEQEDTQAEILLSSRISDSPNSSSSPIVSPLSDALSTDSEKENLNSTAKSFSFRKSLQNLSPTKLNRQAFQNYSYGILHSFNLHSHKDKIVLDESQDMAWKSSDQNNYTKIINGIVKENSPESNRSSNGSGNLSGSTNDSGCSPVSTVVDIFDDSKNRIINEAIQENLKEELKFFENDDLMYKNHIASANEDNNNNAVSLQKEAKDNDCIEKNAYRQSALTNSTPREVSGDQDISKTEDKKNPSIKFNRMAKVVFYRSSDKPKTIGKTRNANHGYSNDLSTCSTRLKKPNLFRKLSGTFTKNQLRISSGVSTKNKNKSILKNSINENSESESIRADTCDAIHVNDFITFLNIHEKNRVDMVGYLSHFRDNQVENYAQRENGMGISKETLSQIRRLSNSSILADNESFKKLFLQNMEANTSCGDIPQLFGENSFNSNIPLIVNNNVDLSHMENPFLMVNEYMSGTLNTDSLSYRLYSGIVSTNIT